MQISNNLAVLGRTGAGNTRDQRLVQQNGSRNVVRVPSASEENKETANQRLVEQTIQGEVIGRDEGFARNLNPFINVSSRTYNVQLQRDVAQSAVNAYQRVAQQEQRDNLINTLGIDVFA